MCAQHLIIQLAYPFLSKELIQNIEIINFSKSKYICLYSVKLDMNGIQQEIWLPAVLNPGIRWWYVIPGSKEMVLNRFKLVKKV